MGKAFNKLRLMAAAIVVLCGIAIPSQALIVSMDIYVDFAILDGGGNYLQDGSIVYIIASGDTNINEMVQIGTNYIADSTTGDDYILAVARIGDNVTSNGTFFLTILFDTALYDHVYLRFFDTTNLPVTGLVAWGTSIMQQVGPVVLGVINQPMNTAPISVTMTNNFVVIPEPSTANLFVMMAGMLWVMRSHMRKKMVKT